MSEMQEQISQQLLSLFKWLRLEDKPKRRYSGSADTRALPPELTIDVDQDIYVKNVIPILTLSCFK